MTGRLNILITPETGILVPQGTTKFRTVVAQEDVVILVGNTVVRIEIPHARQHRCTLGSVFDTLPLRRPNEVWAGLAALIVANGQESL